MDFADIAAEREQLDRDLALKEQANREPAMRPKRSCYYCAASLASGVLFCDSGCRDDYERIKAARVRNGV